MDKDAILDEDVARVWSAYHDLKEALERLCKTGCSATAAQALVKLETVLSKLNRL
jgi:hypothetical protein